MQFQWSINNVIQNDTLHLIDTLVNTNIFDTTIYIVQLIGETKHNCRDSLSKTIRILPDPIAEINLEDTTCFCAPFNTNSLNITANQYDINDSTFWHVYDSSNNLIDSSGGLNAPNINIQNDNDIIKISVICCKWL